VPVWRMGPPKDEARYELFDVAESRAIVRARDRNS